MGPKKGARSTGAAETRCCGEARIPLTPASMATPNCQRSEGGVLENAEYGENTVGCEGRMLGKGYNAWEGA